MADKQFNTRLNEQHQEMLRKISNVYGTDDSTTMRDCLRWRFEQMVRDGLIAPKHGTQIGRTDLAIKIGNKVIPIISPASPDVS